MGLWKRRRTVSFTPLIPATGQSLGNSRTQVLNNFASLRTTISNTLKPNHADVNATNAGKHLFLEMPVQTSGAANLTLSGEFGMIAQAISGVSELFASRDGGSYFQMTAGTPTASSVGKSFLPGGIIVQWGVVNISPGTITFTSIGFQNFPNSCFMIQLTSNAVGVGNTPLAVGTNGGFSNSQFNYAGTAGSRSVNILAIGN